MPSAFLFLLREAVASMTEVEKDEVAELLGPLLDRRFRRMPSHDGLPELYDVEGLAAAGQPAMPSSANGFSPMWAVEVHDPVSALDGQAAAASPGPEVLNLERRAVDTTATGASQSSSRQGLPEAAAFTASILRQPSSELDVKPKHLAEQQRETEGPAQPASTAAAFSLPDDPMTVASPLPLAVDESEARPPLSYRFPVRRAPSDPPAPDGWKMRLPYSLQQRIFEMALDYPTLALRYDPEMSHSDETKEQGRFIEDAARVCKRWATFTEHLVHHRSLGVGKKAGKVLGLAARPADRQSLLDFGRRRRVVALYDDRLFSQALHFENLHHLELSDTTADRPWLDALSVPHPSARLRIRALVLSSERGQDYPEYSPNHEALLDCLANLTDLAYLEALALNGSDDICRQTLAWLDELPNPPFGLSTLNLNSDSVHPLDAVPFDLAPQIINLHVILRWRRSRGSGPRSLGRFTALRHLGVTKPSQRSAGGSHSYPPLADFVANVPPTIDTISFRPEEPLPLGSRVKQVRSFFGPMAWLLKEIAQYHHLFAGIKTIRVFELDLQTFRQDFAQVNDILDELRQGVAQLKDRGMRVLDRRGRTCGPRSLRTDASVFDAPQPPVVSVSSMRLPLEVQRLIFLATIERTTFAFGYDPDVLEDTVADYRWISRSRLVCKDWNTFSTPLLHRHTIMAEKGACEALGINVMPLVQKLLSKPHLHQEVEALYDISAPLSPSPLILQNVHLFTNLVHLDISDTTVVRSWWSRSPPALPEIKLRLRSIVLLSDPPGNGVRHSENAHDLLLDFLADLAHLGCLESLEHEGSDSVCSRTIHWLNKVPQRLRSLSRLAIRSETCAPLAQLKSSLAAKITQLEAPSDLGPQIIIGRPSSKPLKHFGSVRYLITTADARPPYGRWLLSSLPPAVSTVFFHSPPGQVEPRHSDIVEVLNDLPLFGSRQIDTVGFYSLDFPALLRDFDLLRAVDASALRRLCNAALDASRSVRVLDRTFKKWDPARVVARETAPWSANN